MPTTVSFSPASINCGIVPPGGTATPTTQSAVLSAPANVTASISADTSGGALTVSSVSSFVMKVEIESTNPGDLPPGTKPIPVRTDVPVQVAQVSGGGPLAVASGQYVVVTIQFAPTASTPAASTATLLINGDTWNPVSVPITASVGKLSVTMPSTISVVQGSSVKVDVTVTSVAGAGTTAKLILGADGSADAPNVTASLSSTSLTIDAGKSASTTLTVSAGSTLGAGPYSWSLAVWAFDNAYSFSVPFSVVVGQPYYFIKSKLGNVIDIQGASTASGAGLDAYSQKTSGEDNQLWNFVADPAGSGYYYIVSKLDGKAVDIEGASTAAGTLLDAYPQKPYDADNQLWCFVADPATPVPAPKGPQYYFIVSKLNGNVIDIQNASTASGALLDAYPVKLTLYENQLWTVVDGDFPAVLPTVSAPSLSLGGGFLNYYLQNGGDALDGVSVTIGITSDLVSSANGFSFQLNCNSTEGPTVTTQWQQFVIYENPGTNQLVACIATFSGPSDADLLVNIHVPLATLPGTTVPAGYKFNIALTYYDAYPPDGYNDPSSLISGATFTVTDNTGTSLGSTTIAIMGNNMAQTNTPAALANLAPIAAMQLNIGGWENATRAALTGGAGTITYVATDPLSAVWGLPSYVHDAGTGESSNVVFGPLPWPWSSSMETLLPAFSVEQIWEAVSGLAVIEPLEARKNGRGLPPAPPAKLGSAATP